MPGGSHALSLQQLFASAGTFPFAGGNEPASLALGMIHTFAGYGSAFGAPRAEGQIVPGGENSPELVAVIDDYYGGDGQNTVAYPNLSGRVAIGGDPGTLTDGTLTLTWLIAANAPAAGQGFPFAGMVTLFAGRLLDWYPPDGWLACDGSQQDELPGLFAAIGFTYGGAAVAGFDLFNLPDLRGATVVGSGGVAGLSPGQRGNWAIQGLAMNWLICVEGSLPVLADGDAPGTFPDSSPYLGQVIANAGPAVPPGFARCDGSLLAIADHPDLYSVLGPVYGGDGTTTFALPDMRGRMVVGKPSR